MPKPLRAAQFLLASVVAAIAGGAHAATGYSDWSMSSATIGATPAGQLAPAADGSLIGTAESGGPGGHGSVYRVDTHGGMTVLHAFDGRDGQTIVAGVTPGAGGWFYGATAWGAADGLGGIFRVDLKGRFEMLHAFDDGADHGANYVASPLTLGPDGNFYGTTVYAAGYPMHNGTVFRMTPDGQLTVLYVFGTRGRNPYGGVTFGRDGLLYGTTSTDGRETCGLIYAMAPDGTGFKVVHQFDHLVDGCQPQTTMALDADGTMVGTTRFGGPLGGLGAIFRFDPATSAVTVLHTFHDDDPIGDVLQAGVSRDAAGNFYGATSEGSTFGEGALFSLAPDGTLALLHAFAGGATDGMAAATTPTQLPGGGVAGTTLQGGSQAVGTVYRLPAKKPR